MFARSRRRPPSSCTWSVDRLRRQPVRRLAGHRALPLLPVRRGGALGGHAVPDGSEAGHRGIMGKSSGGFGAMITPMLRPDLFGALATHAGDALFEYTYLPEFPLAVRRCGSTAVTSCGGGRSCRGPGCRSQAQGRGPGRTARRGRVLLGRPERQPGCPQPGRRGAPARRCGSAGWSDPVRMVRARRGTARHPCDLDRRREAGTIHPGRRGGGLPGGVARRRESPEPIHFELFDAAHSGIDYRYPLSLAWLCERMAK